MRGAKWLPSGGVEPLQEERMAKKAKKAAKKAKKAAKKK